MRLWHDDVRPPPDTTWTWVRTNDQAIEILQRWEPVVEEISMDHDLGVHVLDPADLEDMEWDEFMDKVDSGEIETTSETGLDLVEWMVANDRVPTKITIHSHNPDGAHRMAMRFVDAGHECVLAPFRP
jgi:hypothetical protein